MATIGRTGRIGLVLAALFVLLAVLLALGEGLDLGGPFDRSGGASNADARTSDAPGPTLQGAASAGTQPASASPMDPDTVDRDRDLHGVVVDEDGAPVAGARLVVLTAPNNRIPRPVAGEAADALVEGPETTSASDGRFALRLAPGVRCDLRAEKAGFARLTLAWVQAGERVRVVMTPGVSLLVIVVDAHGRTRSDTRVELSRFAAHGDVAIQREGRTDDDGQCLFDDLPPHRDAHLYAHPNDGGYPAYAGVTLPRNGRIQQELVLQEGEAIDGRVTDARTGEPLEGARVGKSFRLVGAVRTDAAGRYVIPQWRSRGFRCLHVLAEGYARMQRRVRGAESLDFALTPERPVVGRLTDEAGTPVVGGRVSAVASLLGAAYVHEVSAGGAVSDAEGRFRIGQLRRDLRHLLVINADGYGRTLHWFGPLGDDDAPLDLGDVVLPAPQRLRGRLVHAAGDPCARASVGIRGPLRDDEVPPPAMGPPRYGERLALLTDDLGRFAFADLAPGAYELWAKPAGGTRLRRRVVVPAGGGVPDLEIRLPPADAWRVLVEGPDGEPLRGVRVHLQTADADGSTHALTDEQGTVDFTTPEPPSSVRLHLPTALAARIVAPDVVPWPAGERELRIVLPQVWFLSGRAVDDQGAPLPRAELVVERSGVTLETVWLDDDSAFELRRPDADPVDLVLTGRQYAAGADGRTRILRRPFEGRVDGVAPGSTSVRLQAHALAADRHLTLQVLSPEGEPVTGAQILFFGARPAGVPASITTDEDGHARLDALDARPLDLHVAPPPAQAAAWAPTRLRGVSPAGQEVVARLRANVIVTGRVLRADGQPASGAVVRVAGARGTHGADSDARFTLTLGPLQVPAVLLAEAERIGGGTVRGQATVLAGTSPAEIVIHVR